MSKRLGLIALILLVFSVFVTANDLTNIPQVKNVILMIGDGMGPHQVALANLVSESLYGQPLAMLSLEHHGSVDTSNAQGQVTDSAAGGTAYSIGLRTTNGHVGIDARGNFHFTIFERAQRVGKARGIVTDMSLLDATPASFVSHTNSRDNLSIISASYLITRPEVFLGYDRSPFTRAYRSPRGWDNRDLITELQDLGYAISTSTLGWNQITSGPVAGFYSRRTYAKDGESHDVNQPSLAMMLTKGLELMAQYEDGFFLLVEAGRIDGTGHYNDSVGVAADVIEFDRAVRVALEFQKNNPETLIVITADHETGGMQVNPATYDRFLEVYPQVTMSTVTMDRMMGSNPSINMVRSVLNAAGVPETYTERDLQHVSRQATGWDRQVAIGQLVTKVAGGATFSTTGHSAQLVPYFAQGPNAELLPEVIRNDEMGRFLARSVVGRIDNYWIE